jgi:hypothetical protein
MRPKLPDERKLELAETKQQQHSGGQKHDPDKNIDGKYFEQKDH